MLNAMIYHRALIGNYLTATKKVRNQHTADDLLAFGRALGRPVPFGPVRPIRLRTH